LRSGEVLEVEVEMAVGRDRREETKTCIFPLEADASD